MISQPVIDAHLHLWDTTRFDYPWLADVPTLNRPYLLDDYRRACGNVTVAQMVFLQCDVNPQQSRDEARWVMDLAKRDSRIAGMVPFAPLEQGDAAEEDLAWLTRSSLVKGVRRILQGEADDFCLQSDFVRGVQLLERFGLSFDLCIGCHQLPQATALVEQCPGVSFILDHLGKPDIRTGALEPWREHFARLAAHPNVWCKMSGLVTEADHAHWSPDDLKPYIDHALQTFGVERLIFASDWPVVVQASSLERWMATLDDALSHLSPADRQRIFHDNAATCYRLP